MQRYEGCGGGGGLVFCGPYLRRWVGLGDRKGAELSYIQLGFHREDGVVLPFKENLQERHEIN